MWADVICLVSSHLFKYYVVIKVSVGDGRHGIVYSRKFVLLPARIAHIKSNNCTSCRAAGRLSSYSEIVTPQPHLSFCTIIVSMDKHWSLVGQ